MGFGANPLAAAISGIPGMDPSIDQFGNPIGGGGGGGAPLFGIGSGGGQSLDPGMAALMSSINGQQASMANSQAQAGASVQGSYLDYLARLNATQGQQNVANINTAGAENIAATGAGAQDYGTDEQRQQAFLQNQAQNLGTAAQNQSSLANTAANQYATGTGLDIAKTGAQQQQLATDASRYNTAAGIQNAGIGAQASERNAAIGAQASTIPSLLAANQKSQMLNSPLMSSILGSSAGGLLGGLGSGLGSGGIGGSLGGGIGGLGAAFAKPGGFQIQSPADAASIQGMLGKIGNPTIDSPQVAQYQQSQFAPPTPTAQAPTIPQSMNPGQFAATPTSFPVPVGSGQMAANPVNGAVAMPLTGQAPAPVPTGPSGPMIGGLPSSLQGMRPGLPPVGGQFPVNAQRPMLN